MARFDNDKIQLCYSIIILILVSIGLFRLIRQSRDKPKRQDALIDSIIDNQMPVKALNLALNPSKEGKKLGYKFILIWRESKNIMQKVKELFSKYKGYILASALGILTLLEDYGSFINSVFDGKLVLWGYEVVPVLTLIAAVVVGIFSNGYSKEQNETIKNLFCKSGDDELVTAEIKRMVKYNQDALKVKEKELVAKKQELVNLESALTQANITVQAKQKMFNMTPQLATADDVQEAKNHAVNAEAAVNDKKGEIEKVQSEIKQITTTINALKSQLN